MILNRLAYGVHFPAHSSFHSLWLWSIEILTCDAIINSLSICYYCCRLPNSLLQGLKEKKFAKNNKCMIIF